MAYARDNKSPCFTYEIMYCIKDGNVVIFAQVFASIQKSVNIEVSNGWDYINQILAYVIIKGTMYKKVLSILIWGSTSTGRVILNM